MSAELQATSAPTAARASATSSSSPTSSSARITSRARSPRRSASSGVHLIGFPGCYPNAYALGMMEKLCTHPNVGGALLVSLGCEGFDKRRLARTIEASGRPVLTLGIQDTGGTRKTIAAGREWVERTLPDARPAAAACRWASTSSPSARSAAAPTRPPASPRIPRWASRSTSSSPTARRRSSRRRAS